MKASLILLYLVIIFLLQNENTDDTSVAFSMFLLLLVISLILFILIKTRIISSKWLTDAANFVSIVAGVGAVIFLLYEFVILRNIEKPRSSDDQHSVQSSSTTNPNILPPISSTKNQIPITSSEIEMPPTPVQLPLWEDDFTDSSRAWFSNQLILSEDFTSVGDITNGVMNIDIDCPEKYKDYYCIYDIRVPYDFPDNFYAKFDVTLKDMPLYDPNFSIWIVAVQYRRTETNYYLSMFNSNGNATGRRYSHGDFIYLYPLIPDSGIKKKTDERNTYGILADQENFSIFLNDKNMTNFTDKEYHSGDFYLVLLVYRDFRVKFQIDNFQVYSTKSN